MGDERPHGGATTPTGRLLDRANAAAYLGISEDSLRGLVYRRQIPFVKIGARSLRFDVRQLDRWIERCTTPAEAS